jgi:Uma2 family endonuclease
MAVNRVKTKIADFQAFIEQHPDRFFELINGEIVEIMPSGLYSSEIAANIIFLFKYYLMNDDIGRVTTEQGGYTIDDENVFAPDVSFIRYERLANLPDSFGPIPPDIAVEVVSPSDLTNKKARIQIKLEKYLAAKIPLLWYIYPDRKQVDVYQHGQFVATVGIDGVLDGGDVLPGFSLPVAEIFPRPR